MSNHNEYTSPFEDRYGSHEMREIFSDDHKFSTWRYLWFLLAKAERELGLDISEAQVRELELKVHDINYERAKEIEDECHHDVVAHIRAHGETCPIAKPIIHLGATSCYVTDNTEVLQCYEALLLITKSLISVIEELVEFADRNTDVPTLAYTHHQPAQPTTVGKRACMWIQDLILDLEQLISYTSKIKLLGCKGATGNASSFLKLFDGDEEKVMSLERRIIANLPIKSVFPISGQTYTRKQDSNTMQILSGIAQSASKFANDIRLLSNMGEIEEPHASSQVGSSAMPYKSNPILCERMNSLSRFVICGEQNFAMTASSQWLERTLDDSANRRIVIPEMFLATDELLNIYSTVVKGLQVNYDRILVNMTDKLPFMAAENILMHCVNKGGDRQELHEKLRMFAESAKKNGGGSKFLRLIDKEDDFDITMKEMEEIVMDPALTGMAYTQSAIFLTHVRSFIESINERQGQKA